MSLDELLEYLQLEAAEEFEYFENLADLIEADMDISPEVLYMLFNQIDMEKFSTLLDDYFEDMLNFVPNDAVELYTLLDTVKMALIGMAAHLEEERDLVYLSDEFDRFRVWFSLEPGVLVTELGKGMETEQELSIRDALVLHRMENLGGTKYDYSFDGIDFEMDQYTVSFADLAMEEKAASMEEESQRREDGYDPDSFIELGPEDFSQGTLH